MVGVWVAGFELCKIDRWSRHLYLLDFGFFLKLKIDPQKTSHVPYSGTVVPMPPRKKAVDDTGDETRVQTRSTNVNKHPGSEAQAVLRVSKPRRAPEVVQQEKDQKIAKKEAKSREKLEEKVRQEALDTELEHYRAQQEVDMEKESATIPRHQSRSTSH